MLEKKVVFSFSNIFKLLVFIALASTANFAQNKCLTKAEANKVIKTISNPSKIKNKKKIRRELIKMREREISLNQKVAENPKKNIIEKVKLLNRKHLLRICELYKKHGWLNKKSIKTQGLEAALYLIRNSGETDIQKELFPVLTVATQKGLIPKANLATLIDKIRIKSDGRQIFGTQIKIKDEVGYLYPFEDDTKVADWRKMYELPPISKFIKLIESRYRTVVVKMPQPPRLKLTSKINVPQFDENLIEDENEILSVESSLVNLNVRVLTKDLQKTRGLDLKKEDFLVLENGKEQEISFFSTTDTPFDLILLLDLSGSTVEKQSLIADSAKRFIELARPKDRVAIVSFADYAKVVSPFTNNKNDLYQKVGAINGYGSSKVWDSLAFTYRKFLENKEKKRRSAIVFMTDGVDNTLIQDALLVSRGRWSYSQRPSRITFTKLLETVRKNEANIFSIYLDTELYNLDKKVTKKSYRQARRTLKMLSEESGGQYYRAGQVGDLSGIYKQIINDLSEVYSLGYEPKGDPQSGTWRELKIKIKNRTDLIVKSKKGYYAK